MVVAWFAPGGVLAFVAAGGVVADVGALLRGRRRRRRGEGPSEGISVFFFFYISAACITGSPKNNVSRPFFFNSILGLFRML